MAAFELPPRSRRSTKPYILECATQLTPHRVGHSCDVEITTVHQWTPHAHQDGTFDTELRTHESRNELRAVGRHVHALDERDGLGTWRLDLTGESLDQLMRRDKDQQRRIRHCLRQTDSLDSPIKSKARAISSLIGETCSSKTHIVKLGMLDGVLRCNSGGNASPVAPSDDRHEMRRNVPPATV